MKNILIILLFIMATLGLYAEVLVSDSFDGLTFPPAGWTQNTISGNYYWERTTTGYQPTNIPHSGTAFAVYRSYFAAEGNSASLITPPFTASTGYTYTVSFWMCRDAGYPTYEDQVRIYTNYSTANTGRLIATVHRSIYLAPLGESSGWQFYSFEFTPVAIDNISYIIINALSAEGEDLNIDDVTVSRESATVPPQPAVIVSPAHNAVNMPNTTTLNWLNGGGEPTDYDVYCSTDNPPHLVTNQTETTYAPALAFNTTYYWQIVPHNQYGDAIGCPIWTFTTSGSSVNMTDGSQIIPNGVTCTFFDSGGPSGTYQTSENYTFTFISANPAKAIHADFTSFDTQAGYDKLKVYNGPDISSPQLGPVFGYSGMNALGSIVGSNAITFVFTSDGTENHAGWEASVYTDSSSVTNEDHISTPAVATALNSNYPNPFKLTTSISFAVKGNSPVVVEIYNTKGQRVKTIINEIKAAGNYSVKWDGTDQLNQKVTSGIYFCKMQAVNYTSIKKMILMK